MFLVEQAETRAGRETAVVRHGSRRVGSASLGFIKWMSDNVPIKQLRDEQKALVNWYINQPRSEVDPVAVAISSRSRYGGYKKEEYFR